ncbi:MAG TPA: hypothetical protein VMH28_23630 [Candidatus Acidoferrales bacterium]|nr:hypothetical protein [Candidatus Acidoferrales bacterium]
MAELRGRLKRLRDGLLHLHKSLLDSERAAYERDIARITSAGQYLQLVMNDPWFQWLRELSQFVVLIDETLDEKEPAANDADLERLVAQARILLVPDESGRGFARRYFEVLQRDPAAVLAHRDMLKVMAEAGMMR